ncbi:hypothetical protein NP233_g3729 [Leucocoprinus birnbaumii]|uniref:HAT C-terminal dimerisation domain-containing protein n=1 Tax=Leucocoprinus birnbaumii TaxID=56174 RepID=A0AAD5YW73_9AGAR|nr:hypothetical protein NP233_g3729 [Leucocoprinus birnbaumii]
MDFILCYNISTGTYNTTGHRYRGHFSIWLTNEIQEHVIALEDMFDQPAVISVPGWVNGNLYVPTQERFGILPVPDDVCSQSGIDTYNEATDQDQHFWFLASKQGTHKPILPVHTDREQQLFRSLLQTNPVFSSVSSEPNWREGVRIWNRNYAACEGEVYYKLVEQLRAYYTKWQTLNNAHNALTTTAEDHRSLTASIHDPTRSETAPEISLFPAQPNCDVISGLQMPKFLALPPISEQSIEVNQHTQVASQPRSVHQVHPPAAPLQGQSVFRLEEPPSLSPDPQCQMQLIAQQWTLSSLPPQASGTRTARKKRTCRKCGRDDCADVSAQMKTAQHLGPKHGLPTSSSPPTFLSPPRLSPPHVTTTLSSPPIILSDSDESPSLPQRPKKRPALVLSEDEFEGERSDDEPDEVSESTRQRNSADKGHTGSNQASKDTSKKAKTQHSKTSGKKAKGPAENASGTPPHKVECICVCVFEPIPDVIWQMVPETKGSKTLVNRQYFVFKCTAPHCAWKTRFVNRVVKGSDQSSTRNLRRHAIACWGQEALDAADGVDVDEARAIMKGRNNKAKDGSIIDAFKSKSKVLTKDIYSTKPPTKTEIRADIVRWVCESKRPFEVVNDKGFHRLMKRGRPHHYVPSATTVHRDLRVTFIRGRQIVSRLLRKNEGRLHFGTDAWTSPNHRAFVGVEFQREVEGTIESCSLDLLEVPRSHTGEVLAEAFTDILNEYGISQKKQGLACDNAAPNDVMVREIANLIPGDKGQASRVCCFCHVINLVTRSILALFDTPKSPKKRTKGGSTRAAKRRHLDSGDDEEEANGIEGATVGTDADGYEVEGEEVAVASEPPELVKLAGSLADEEEPDGGEDDVEEAPEEDNCDGWIDECEVMPSSEKKVTKDRAMPAQKVLVKIRKVAYAVKNSSTILFPLWSDICKSKRLKQKIMSRDVKTRWNSTFDMLRDAIDYRKVYDEITALRSTNLREYKLSDEEWKIAGQLFESLKIFKEATEFFSRKNVSNISWNKDYDMSIREALKLGQRTLNRYYSKTDMSEAYHIAMILDPQHKLEYMRQAGWPQPLIRKAEQLVRTEFKARSADSQAEGPMPSTSTPSTSSTSTPKNRFDHLAFTQKATGVSTEFEDEVTRYLSVAPHPCEDPIRWWYENQHTYPKLSRMARDFLSIPATSVGVERMFSKGRILLSHLRNSLSPITVRSLLCLGEWIEAGLVTDKDIVVAISGLPDLGDDAEDTVEPGWDHIQKD